MVALISLEASCRRCGVVAAITDASSEHISYTIKPHGFGLADICPVVKARTEEQERNAPEDCPNLLEAIEARIQQFKEQS